MINPGSTGQPCDGDPRAAYAVLGCSDGRLEVVLARLKYNIDTVISQVSEYGLSRYAVEKLRDIIVQGGVF